MRHSLTTRGFSLIEVLLYIALASGVLYVTSTLYSVIVVNSVRNDTRAHVDLSSFHTLRIITDAVRHAKSVVEPTMLSSSDTLILEMEDPERDPTIITVSGGYVEIQEGGEAPIQVSASDVSVSPAEFSNRSNTETSSTIHIEFVSTLRDESGRGELEYSATYYGSATTK